MSGIEQEPGKPLDTSLRPDLRRAILAAGLGEALGFTFDLTPTVPIITSVEPIAASLPEPDFFIESVPGQPALVVVRRGKLEHHTKIPTPRQIDIVNLLADYPREPFSIADILGEVGKRKTEHPHTKQSVSQNLHSIRTRTSDSRGPVVLDRLTSGRKLFTLQVGNVIRGLPQAS